MLNHVMQRRPGCLLQSARGETNRILLASALSSVRIICPNRESWRDGIIAVSLGCFDSLRTSSFQTNWYHLMPSSIRRHHWSDASILRASVFDIAQQSNHTGTFVRCTFVQVASHDLQIWFSRLCMAAQGIKSSNHKHAAYHQMQLKILFIHPEDTKRQSVSQAFWLHLTTCMMMQSRLTYTRYYATMC